MGGPGGLFWTILASPGPPGLHEDPENPGGSRRARKSYFGLFWLPLPPWPGLACLPGLATTTAWTGLSAWLDQ